MVWKKVKFKKVKPETAFNKKQLKTGVSVEREHTENKGVRSIIARHHLQETPSYYKKLKKCRL